MNLFVNVLRKDSGYCCRLYDANKLVDESICIDKADIPYCFNYMLSWYCKAKHIKYNSRNTGLSKNKIFYHTI